MKKIHKFLILTAFFLFAVLSLLAQPKTISFTPHSYVSGKLMPDGQVYDNWQWNNNINGVKDRYTFMQYATSPIQYKLHSPKPAETYHFTEIQVAGTDTKGKWAGLSYVLCKAYNTKAGQSSTAKTYISENGQNIAAQIEKWYLGDNTAPVIMQVKRQGWNVGDIIHTHIWANGSFTLDIPPWLQVVEVDFLNAYGYINRSWTKFFDGSHIIDNNSLKIIITPTDSFYKTPKGVTIPADILPLQSWDSPVYGTRGTSEYAGGSWYNRGKRTIGSITFRAIAPADDYIQGVQEGYFFIRE